MTTRVRRTTGSLLRVPGAGIAAIAVFWLGVGVASALQRAAALRLEGDGVGLVEAVHRGVIAGLPWVPLTLAVILLARRLPLRGAGWRRALAAHLPACLALPFVYNVLFHLLWRPGASPGAVADAALRHGLENLHLIAGTYWAIVAVEGWTARIREEAEGSGAGSRSRAPEPGEGGPKPPDVLTVRSGHAVDVVPVDAISWIEGAGDYARLHTADGAHLSSATLKALARRLSHHGFLRVHRSAIVRLDRIRSYRPLGHGDYELTLDDGTALRVSRSYGRRFRRRMEA